MQEIESAGRGLGYTIGYAIGYNFWALILLAAALVVGVCVWRYRRR